MSYMINNQQKVNDIIFEKRNKNYGAYAIRSEYGNTLFKSISLMMLGFGVIMSTILYFSNKPNGGDQGGSSGTFIPDTAIVTTFKMPEPDPKPEPKVAQGGGHTEKGIATVISNTVIEEPSSTSVTTGAVTNTSTVDGPPGPSVTVSGTTAVTFTNTIVDQGPVLIPDSFPEFEGGPKALVKFLASQLKYPEYAFGDGIEGTVFVKFVVDQYGRVGNLSLLNNVGYGLDEEAMRVVALIPKFKKPGKVNGRAVKVYYQVPIRFKISK